MPYQSVNSCRFYVDTPSFLKQTGVHIPSGLNISDEDIHGFYGLNPTNPLGSGDADHQLGYQSRMIPVSNDGKNNYIAVLGHSGLENIWLNTTSISGSTNDVVSGIVDIEEIINFTLPIQFNGFSMATFTNATPDDIYYHLYPVCQSSNEIFIGSLSVGTFYDMPHSPDLNLTMSREYGGIKTIETQSGASLSNAFYIKPPMWGDLPPWELSAISGSDEAAHTIPDRGDAKLGASGRRIWDLSFSYLSDSSVFPDNPELADAGGFEVDDTPTDFMSQVLKYTRGSQLPFIFQPDKENNDPFSGFAICKFDQKSFSFQQTAPNLYSCKMKIREVW